MHQDEYRYMQVHITKTEFIETLIEMSCGRKNFNCLKDVEAQALVWATMNNKQWQGGLGPANRLFYLKQKILTFLLFCMNEKLSWDEILEHLRINSK